MLSALFNIVFSMFNPNSTFDLFLLNPLIKLYMFNVFWFKSDVSKDSFDAEDLFTILTFLTIIPNFQELRTLVLIFNVGIMFINLSILLTLLMYLLLLF